MKTLTNEELLRFLTQEEIAKCCNYYFDLLDSIGYEGDLCSMGYTENQANEINDIRKNYASKYWVRVNN